MPKQITGARRPSASTVAMVGSYVAQLLQFVSERVRESVLASSGKRSDEMAQVTLAEQGRILKAIEDRDPAAASAAMRGHLNNAAARVGLGSSPKGAA